MIPRAPKGTDDILPPESERWRTVLRTFDELAERYGYQLVFTPIFEHTELFARGVGEETDVVEKQMYTFEDRGGRSLTLRPEATASVVRAHLDRGGDEILKVSYAGPMFRYEQPQAGRRRQFFQVGVEYIGEPSPEADVEVIEVGYRCLQACGIADASVLLNSIGDPEDRVAYRDLLYRFLDERREDLSSEAARRIDTSPLRALDSKQDDAVLEGAPVPIDHLGSAAATHHAAVEVGLRRQGIPFVAAPRLVRGLDYYNRTVFEYQAASYRVAQSALGGGGRYDPLAAMLGGSETPGVGLAMGVDRVVLAMPDVVDAPALDAFVVWTGAERLEAALAVASSLRGAGFSADLDLSGKSVRSQFRAADRRRATAAIVVGSEWDEGLVTVKRLASGEESTMTLEETQKWLKNR
ncbi:MAG: histidine--tRNA ligase [Acidimicrobiia bacterium]